MRARRAPRDAGQILVFLLFASVLLVGFVYLLIRTGERVVARQELQNAADAAAFAAAAIKARGMNLIAFLNLVMAALVAILVALQLLHDAILVIAAGISAACCAACLGTCCGVCAVAFYAPAQELAAPFQTARDALQEPIMAAASLLEPVQDAVAALAPAWASVEAWRVARENADAARTLTWPAYEGLPVHRDEFAPVCEHAIDMATWPIERVLPGWLGSAVAGLVGRWAESNADYYCGSSAGAAPQTEPYARVVQGCGLCASVDPPVWGSGPDLEFPEDDLVCGNAMRGPVYWVQKKQRRVKRFEPPDAASPEVGPVEDAEWPNTAARCDRAPPDAYEGEELLDNDEPACPGSCNGNPACRRRRDEGEPACGDFCSGCTGSWQAADEELEFAPAAPSARFDSTPGPRFVPDAVARVVTEERTIWVEVVACTLACQMTGDAGFSPASVGEPPRAMALDDGEDDHWAGSGANQVRAFALRADDLWGRRRAVGVGAWGRGAARDLAPTSVLALAQGEFFAASGDLWEMDWRARVRRFYLPPGGVTASPEAEALGILGADLADGMQDRLEAVGLGEEDDADFPLRRFLVH